VPDVEFHAKKLMEAGGHNEAQRHIDALLDERTPAAINAMVKALKNVNAASPISFALAEVGKPAVPALIKALKNEDVTAAQNSASALGEIGDKSAVPALIKALEHENLRVVRGSAIALGQIGDKRALPHLMRLADHPDEVVRQMVKNAIKKIREGKHA
jgi:HEAT repeat protein